MGCRPAAFPLQRASHRVVTLPGTLLFNRSWASRKLPHLVTHCPNRQVSTTLTDRSTRMQETN